MQLLSNDIIEKMQTSGKYEVHAACSAQQDSCRCVEHTEQR